MKITKCPNCGMSDFEQNGNLYTCKYCNAQYEESEGAFKALLSFTERQLDKARESKKEKNENRLKERNQRKQEKLDKEEQRRQDKLEEERQRLKEAEQRKKEKEEKAIRKSRKQAGVCQHCGAHFRGIFKKTCSKCGKAKDYSRVNLPF